MQVGVNYDPMIAKIIVRGPDRQTALRRMHAALSDLQVRLRKDSETLLTRAVLKACPAASLWPFVGCIAAYEGALAFLTDEEA